MNSAMEQARNRSQPSLMLIDPCSSFCQLQIELEIFYEINAFRERCNNQKCNASAIFPLSCEGDLEGRKWRQLCLGFEFGNCFVVWGVFLRVRENTSLSQCFRQDQRSLLVLLQQPFSHVSLNSAYILFPEVQIQQSIYLQ